MRRSRPVRRVAALAIVGLLTAACGGDTPQSDAPATMGDASAATPGLITLWGGSTPAFGVFVPSEREPGARDSAGNRMPPLYTVAGATALAADTLLDFLFLNLEGAYDEEAVGTLLAGLEAGATSHRPTLLVRIPTIEAAGADSTRARVARVLALGADGVVIPHVRSPEEAELATSFFAEAGANVWSPENPTGTTIAMLMVEDAGAIASLDGIVAVKGYSMLSCGIGSLTRDMGGDSAGAEAACLSVREAASARGMPSMMTANANTVTDRIDNGYLGILMGGTMEQATPVIAAGRAHAGR